MIKNKNKLAFIHYPYHPDNARLDTMPFVFNTVKYLDDIGWSIDLFLWEEDTTLYKEIFSEGVNIITLDSLKQSQLFKLADKDFLNIYRITRLIFTISRLKQYACVFALGQMGAMLSNRVVKKSKCPLVYYSDELPGSWPYYPEYLKDEEKKAIVNSSLIVIPDQQRIKPLCCDLDLSIENYIAKFAIIPNAPLINNIDQTINWHERLQLPDGSIPFIHAGSISDWAQVPEIMCTVPYWPDEAVLILHSRNKMDQSVINEYSHLYIKDKIFWSNEPLDENQLASLISYCSGSFSLYRDKGENIKNIGWSSGKLLRSICCGSPVIASNFESLSFIKQFDLGYLVNNPSEIPQAIEKIILNREKLHENCLDYSRKNLDFNTWWQHFMNKFNKKTNVDLLQN